MELSRQEYWSGLPFPTSGYLPDPGTELASLVFCTGRQILYHECHLGSPLLKKIKPLKFDPFIEKKRSLREMK